MDISGAQIVVVVMGMIVMAVRLVQQIGARHVYAQTDGRDNQGVGVMHRDRFDETAHGFHRNAERQQAQHNGAGKGGQIAELARAEGKPRIAGMAARQPIGRRRKSQRADMGRHMHAVGEQRHGAEHKARGDFDHHEGGGQRRDQPGALFRMRMALAEKDVAMRPITVVVRRVH